MTNYLRDGRAPIPQSEVTSRVMRANRGKDTKPEIMLRRALREAGFPGYRLHWRKVSGRPDIAYPGRQFAIFIHGCFWHRCPHCRLPLPKSNVLFWKEKFKRNEERDARKLVEISAIGWHSMVVWECEIRKDVKAVVQKIESAFHEQE